MISATRALLTDAERVPCPSEGTKHDVVRRDRVLIAEDDPVSREATARLVSFLGFAASTVGDGDAAMAALLDARYGLLLTDVHMPGMDGLELAKRVRAVNCPARHIRIIAITGDSAQLTAQQRIGSEIDDYLLKPLSIEGLRAKLVRWSTHHEKRQIDTRVICEASSSYESRIIESRAGVLELDQLMSLFRGKLHKLFPLLEKYAAITRAEVKHLVESCIDRDASVVTAQVHRLKGSALSVGATGLARCCVDIEASLLTNDWAAVRRNLRCLIHEQKIVDRYIHRLLERNRAILAEAVEAADGEIIASQSDSSGPLSELC